MNVMEIIKDAFVFPSKDLKNLLIFIVLSLVAGAFAVGGFVLYIGGFIVPEFFMWGGMACIVSMIIGWIMSGYLISVIKSGIDQDDKVPGFVWWDNFINGFNNFVVAIVYFIIPAFIVFVVAYLTNVFGNFMIVAQGIMLQAEGSYLGYSTSFLSGAISQALINLAISLATTAAVAVIVFVIFSFFQTMAQARLANTGSLGEALNVMEAAKDIRRIGIGKVIAVVLLIIIVVAVINMILSIIPFLSILSIIVTPYMIIFAQRAIGLLYSDIA